MTIRLEETRVAELESESLTFSRRETESFSRRYDRLCPKIAKRILACAPRAEFTDAVLAHVGSDSRRVVQAETARAIAGWRKAGAAQTCEEWMLGFYGGAILADAAALGAVSDAAGDDCAEFGSALAENGGLPQLIPAR